MFCRMCGTQVPDGTRFCPHCGARLWRPGDPAGAQGAGPARGGGGAGTRVGQAQGGVTAAAPAPAGGTRGTARGSQAPEPVPTPAGDRSGRAPRRSVSRRAVVAGLGVAAGVAAAAAATRALGLWGGDEGEEASSSGEAAREEAAQAAYGSAEPTLVSLYTAIEPRDEAGGPVPSYTVRVRAATDAEGRDVDVSEIDPYEVGDGSAGFTLANLGDLQPGTYELTITTGDGGILWLPPLLLAGGDAAPAGGPSSSGEGTPPSGGAASSSSSEAVPQAAPDRLVVLPAALLAGASASSSSAAPAEATARLGKWGAYLKVLRDAIDEYGETKVTSGTDDYGECGEVEGVASAFLQDFGDGNERLVLAYWGQDTYGNPCPYVGVWEYQEDADEASQVLEAPLDTTDGSWLYVVTGDDGTHSYIVVPLEGRVYGLGEEETFVTLCDWGYDEALGEVVYRVEGKEVSEQVYWQAWNNYVPSLEGEGATVRTLGYVAEWGGIIGLAPDEVAQEAKETRDRLEALAGDLLDAWEEQQGDS